MTTLRKLKNGHTVEEMSEEEFEKFSKYFPMFSGFVKLNPGEWFYPASLPPILDKIFDFEFRPTDTLVITQPKSGTTWMLEIVWTLFHNPDLNNPEAERSSDLRSPHMEIGMLLNNKKVPKLTETSEATMYLKSQGIQDVTAENLSFAFLKVLKDPRVIKTHLPLDLLPPSVMEKTKIIYVARDPRDVIVSKYHFHRQWVPFSFQGTLDDSLDIYLKEQHFHHPYWSHVKTYYDLKDRPNMLFLYFEDLKKDPKAEITKISNFLGLSRTSQQIQNVVDHTNFINMKKRGETGSAGEPMTDGGRYIQKVEEGNTGFFRKGTSGNWKDSFTDDQISRITTWMEENMKMFPEDFKYKHKN